MGRKYNLSSFDKWILSEPKSYDTICTMLQMNNADYDQHWIDILNGLLAYELLHRDFYPGCPKIDFTSAFVFYYNGLNFRLRGEAPGFDFDATTRRAYLWEGVAFIQTKTTCELPEKRGPLLLQRMSFCIHKNSDTKFFYRGAPYYFNLKGFRYVEYAGFKFYEFLKASPPKNR
jgi:hypothetical protein